MVDLQLNCFFVVCVYNYKRQVCFIFLDIGCCNIIVVKGGLVEFRCRIKNLGFKEVGKIWYVVVYIMENGN